MANTNLGNARKTKNDEFYTQLPDIERELKNYKHEFKGKSVFCNCDDPESSNFYYYFVSHFEELALEEVVTTHFETDKKSYMIEYHGGVDIRGDKETILKRANKIAKKVKLKQNFEQGIGEDLFENEPTRSFSGDFRSPECIELLKNCDIVVTNPPFSLFREYVDCLMKYDKKFLIIGNDNCRTYKEIFRQIRENKLWSGYNHVKELMQPDGTMKKFGNVSWYTNLEVNNRHEDLVLFEEYNAKKYTKYDNYDAIEISQTKNIPMDFEGVMGVPISFLDKYNPQQFEIIGLIAGNIRGLAGIPSTNGKDGPYMNGKLKYGRILIKNRNPVKREAKECK